MVAGHLLIDDKASITGIQLIFSVFSFFTFRHCYLIFVGSHMGLNARKPVFGIFSNNKGADQPAHQRRLISAFAIRFWESIISKLAIAEITIF